MLNALEGAVSRRADRPWARARQAARRLPSIVQKRFPWLLLALTVGHVVHSWSNPHGFPLYFGHSGAYLRFDPDRSAGYPVFIDAVVAVFGAVEAVPKVQLVLGAAALAFLGWCMHRAFRMPVVGLFPICVPIVRSEPAQFQAAIGAESLFTSLLCVMLGALVLLVERSTWRWAAVSALACGLAVAVRPAGMSLLPIWPIALWFIRERCKGQYVRMAAAVAAPVALCLLGESLIWRAEHGSGIRPNRADPHLYGKALLTGPALAAPDDAAPGFVAEARELAAPMRDLIAAAPDFQTRLFLLVNAEFQVVRAAEQQIFYRTERRAPKRFHADAYRTARDIGRASAVGDPVSWASNALTHYRGYWTVYEYYEPDFLRRFHAYVEPALDHPYFGAADFHLPPMPRSSSGPSWSLASSARHDFRWVMACILFSSILASVLVLRQLRLRRRAGAPAPDGRLVVAFLCGLLVHGHFLATGLFSHGLMRYVFTMWPAMFLCSALMFDWMLQSGRRAWMTRLAP